jgi:dCTP deaminase
MAKLTGLEILKEVEAGHIIIDPFDKSRINPNSYNLRLGNRLLTYKSVSSRPDFDQNMEERIRSLPRASNRQPSFNEIILDSHSDNPTEEHIIPESGFLLQPGILYLGTTVEKTWTDRYVPELGGRSSTGRLSMMVHVTAGYGDVGFDGRLPLEIVVFHNLIVYPNDEVLQIHFTTTKGDLGYQYNGRYNHQEDVTASRFYMPKMGAYRDIVEK